MSYPVLDAVSWTDNSQDKNDVFPYGIAIESWGLANISAVNGYGLVTMGFLWQGHSVWGPYIGISLTTSWSTMAGNVTLTTWTKSTGGVFGEYPALLP